MKKHLFLTAFMALSMFSCTKNEVLQSESSTLIEVKVSTYNYQGKNYSLKFDISDKGNTILLEGKDNEVLAKIHEDQEQLTTVYVDDSTFYLFDNMKDYEKSTLYAENEKKAAQYKKNIKGKINSITNKTVSISSTLPAYGTNYNQEAYLYRRSKLRFNDGGYYVTPVGPGSILFQVPDFRYLNNNSPSYGAGYSSLFPLSSYNIANTVDINHNDAISSLYVNLMKVTVYEHQNYTGKSMVFDARGSAYNRILYKNLKDVTYSCGFLCWKNWNDKISSASFVF